MNPLAIGHAELYIYPENTIQQDGTTIMPHRMDVSDIQALVEVLNIIPNETSFSVLLVMNECVVGNGNYFMAADNAVMISPVVSCPLAFWAAAVKSGAEYLS